MERIDSEAHGSLQTIREARVERVRSQEEGACLMLSHGEGSGRDSDERREAGGEKMGPHCPVSLMRKTGHGGHPLTAQGSRKRGWQRRWKQKKKKIIAGFKLQIRAKHKTALMKC